MIISEVCSDIVEFSMVVDVFELVRARHTNDVSYCKQAKPSIQMTTRGGQSPKYMPIIYTIEGGDGGKGLYGDEIA
eukprot:scaffold2237_cov175-Ochromonas_danica.AAC.11